MRPITARALGQIRHGFFTREGGVSTGIYVSLNGGPGSADDPAAIAENRRRIAAHLGADHLLSLHQIHSDKVVTVREPWGEERPQADAMVTDRPGIALGVLSADCAPVLLADAKAGVIGAAHAGWRGALAGVLEATIDAMQALGAKSERIVAVIGPVISQRAYEVGPEFVEQFLIEDRAHGRFFAGGEGDRTMFDLPGFCLSRLRAAGASAEWTWHCTHADPARFYSYRRSRQMGEEDYGRLAAGIVL